MNRKAVDFSTLNFDLVDLLLWKIKKGHGSKRGTDQKGARIKKGYGLKKGVRIKKGVVSGKMRSQNATAAAPERGFRKRVAEKGIK